MQVTNYLWDVVSDNVLMEKDDEGETIARYVQEPELYGEAISQERDGERRYYNFDGEGNTCELTNEAQGVTDTYEYSAFGKEITRTGTTANPFQWIGAAGFYRDPETGTYCLRSRTYAPARGRWIGLGREGLLDGSFYSHSYANNNPSSYFRVGNVVRVGVDQKVVDKGCTGCGNFEWEVQVSLGSVVGHPDPRESAWVLVQEICPDRKHEYCSVACGCSPNGTSKVLKCCHNEIIGLVYIKSNTARLVGVGGSPPKRRNAIIDRWTFQEGGDGECHSKGKGKISSELYLVPRTEEHDKILQANAPFDLLCGDFTIQVGKGPETINTDAAAGHSSAYVNAKWNCCPKPKLQNHCSSGSITLGG